MHPFSCPKRIGGDAIDCNSTRIIKYNCKRTNFGGFGYRLENGYRVCWLTQRGEKVVKEMEEQAEKLMVQRVKELREEDGMRTSKPYDLELKEQVDRMERILYSLSEEDRAWLDAQLTDILYRGSRSSGVIFGWIS